MKVLALETTRPGAVAADFLPHLKEEAQAVWALHQSGVVREIYFRSDRKDAVLVLECGSTDEAANILSSLPLVKAGLIRFDVVGLVPYDGFGRLFDQPRGHGAGEGV